MSRMTIGAIHMHRMRSSIYIAIAAFFAGCYGMNFRELGVTSLGGILDSGVLVIVIRMLLYSGRKRWIV